MKLHPMMQPKIRAWLESLEKGDFENPEALSNSLYHLAIRVGHCARMIKAMQRRQSNGILFMDNCDRCGQRDCLSANSSGGIRDASGESDRAALP
jgi:hypothetical protein